eukprot:TRINITY_DN3980_c0_g3_i1.p1 TRINITY_DN3980_c0_g3~~TRINITY_DN3980_c0_g3_i1.p1  ORF type:complete len:932 (-),score=190.05 TRINITY_DN3980_c0_g3_i1:368-3163(-)
MWRRRRQRRGSAFKGRPNGDGEMSGDFREERGNGLSGSRRRSLDAEMREAANRNAEKGQQFVGPCDSSGDGSGQQGNGVKGGWQKGPKKARVRVTATRRGEECGGGGDKDGGAGKIKEQKGLLCAEQRRKAANSSQSKVGGGAQVEEEEEEEEAKESGHDKAKVRIEPCGLFIGSRGLSSPHKARSCPSGRAQLLVKDEAHAEREIETTECRIGRPVGSEALFMPPLAESSQGRNQPSVTLLLHGPFSPKCALPSACVHVQPMSVKRVGLSKIKPVSNGGLGASRGDDKLHFRDRPTVALASSDGDRAKCASSKSRGIALGTRLAGRDWALSGQQLEEEERGEVKDEVEEMMEALMMSCVLREMLDVERRLPESAMKPWWQGRKEGWRRQAFEKAEEIEKLTSSSKGRPVNVHDAVVSMSEFCSAVRLTTAGSLDDASWERHISSATADVILSGEPQRGMVPPQLACNAVVARWRRLQEDISQWTDATPTGIVSVSHDVKSIEATRERRKPEEGSKSAEEEEEIAKVADQLQQLFPGLDTRGARHFSPLVTAAVAIAASRQAGKGDLVLQVDGALRPSCLDSPLVQLPLQLLLKHQSPDDLDLIRRALEREKRHISALLEELDGSVAIPPFAPPLPDVPCPLSSGRRSLETCPVLPSSSPPPCLLPWKGEGGGEGEEDEEAKRGVDRKRGEGREEERQSGEGEAKGEEIVRKNQRTKADALAEVEVEAGVKVGVKAVAKANGEANAQAYAEVKADADSDGKNEAEGGINLNFKAEAKVEAGNEANAEAEIEACEEHWPGATREDILSGQSMGGLVVGLAVAQSEQNMGRSAGENPHSPHILTLHEKIGVGEGKTRSAVIGSSGDEGRRGANSKASGQARQNGEPIRGQRKKLRDTGDGEWGEEESALKSRHTHEAESPTGTGVKRGGRGHD